MSKAHGWYEGTTLVMQYAFTYKNALDMAEFEELMSAVVEAEVEEVGARNMVVHSSWGSQYALRSQ